VEIRHVGILRSNAGDCRRQKWAIVGGSIDAGRIACALCTLHSS
jgi:hypothetical protein